MARQPLRATDIFGDEWTEGNACTVVTTLSTVINGSYLSLGMTSKQFSLRVMRSVIGVW